MVKKYTYTLFILTLLSCSISDSKSYKNVSEEELDNFARDLVSKIEMDPVNAFNGLIDIDILFNRMYREKSLDYSVLDYQLKSGFESGLTRFYEAIAVEIENGSYDLVKTEVREDGGHMIFRLYGAGGMNIHDFLIVNSDGNPAIADIYIYTAGEDLSKLLGSIFSFMLTESNAIKKEFSDAKLAEIKSIGNVRRLIQGGSYEEAYNLLQEVGPEFKKEKFWHILNIESASGLDSARYISAMENFGKQYQKDPSWHLMGIDYYFLIGDYNSAINSLDGLQQLLGKDPIIELMKANTYWALNEYDKAYELINDNLPQAQNLEDFYFTKASCEGHLKMYDSLESTLRTMYEDFSIEIVDLDYTGFEDFQETIGFQKLMEEQGYEYTN